MARQLSFHRLFSPRRPSHRTTRFILRYLECRAPRTQQASVSRFIDFAIYLGMERGKWLEALQRLLRMSRREGLGTIRAFSRWLETVGGKDVSTIGPFGGLRPLIRMASKEGVLGWELNPHPGNKVYRFRKGCPKDYLDAVDKWIEELRIRNYSEGSLSQYSSKVVRLGAYLERKKIDWTGLGESDLRRWIRGLKAKRWPSCRIAAHISAIRQFYEWLRLNGTVEENPAQEIHERQGAKKRHGWLTEEEMAGVLDLRLPTRDRAIFETLYATGCRIGEITNLDIGDVDLNTRLVRCRGKSGERIVFLTRPAVRALKRYLKEREGKDGATPSARDIPLFVNRSSKRLRVKTAQKMLLGLGRMAGLNVRLSPHLIRHTFATHLLARGASIFDLQKLMGHRRPSVTAIYAKVTPERLVKVYRGAVPRK